MVNYLLIFSFGLVNCNLFWYVRNALICAFAPYFPAGYKTYLVNILFEAFVEIVYSFSKHITYLVIYFDQNSIITYYFKKIFWKNICYTFFLNPSIGF